MLSVRKERELHEQPPLAGRLGDRWPGMFHSIRAKLIASFIGVSLVVGAFSLVVGTHLLDRTVRSEASMRVSLDLNSALELYRVRTKTIDVALNITTLGYGFIDALKERDTAGLKSRLERMSHYAALDFAGIVDGKGALLCRNRPNPIPGRMRPPPANPIAGFALEKGESVSGTFVLSREFLLEENPGLAERARVDVIPTPGTQPGSERAVTAGLVLAAAVPVFHEGEVLGVLYAGVLLNRDTKLVDTVKGTVFHNEEYRGRSVGRASIFLGDVRIATNVPAQDGGRAIGTRVAEEVREHVLENDERWTRRAPVIGDWYITAYEPIKDVHARTVGILGVGVLDEKYEDVRWNVLSIFIFITALGMLLAAGLGCLVAGRIIRPIQRLVRASEQVTEGSLTPDIGPVSEGEIGVLQKAFREMVSAMGRRRMESQNRLILSEKQASVGRLAAGVAHEINNPLTGVLTYTHMLLKRKDMNEDVRADLRTIAEATDRVRKIVKGLLDFSRQTPPDREKADVNTLVRSTIALMENQALVKGVRVKFKPGENLSPVNMDRSQFQSVLLNILINGLDATKSGEGITVTTKNSDWESETGQKGVEISITDTGCGIPPEHIDKLFDPFFTTKEVGQGTGLGLAVSLGIVQRHGGSIRVQSEVGKGSTFAVWVPLEGRVV
jgi:two-component system, NtrC family, sensor kinase